MTTTPPAPRPSEALAGARRVGAPTLLAGALGIHAFAVCDDHPDEALAAAEESVRLTEAGAGDTGYSLALSLGANVRAAAGDHAGAARALRTAIVHEAGTGNRTHGDAVNRTALVLAGLPDTFEAAATLAGAVAGPVLGVFPGVAHPATAGPLPTTPRPGGRHPRRRALRRRPTAGGGQSGPRPPLASFAAIPSIGREQVTVRFSRRGSLCGEARVRHAGTRSGRKFGHRRWSAAWPPTKTCALIMLRSVVRFHLAPRESPGQGRSDSTATAAVERSIAGAEVHGSEGVVSSAGQQAIGGRKSGFVA